MADWDQHQKNQFRHAKRESDNAQARLLGMKIRHRLFGGPSAATGGFPYPGRTARGAIRAGDMA